jgi:TetR/AcrR family transcriptional repressor for divergent bdcA
VQAGHRPDSWYNPDLAFFNLVLERYARLELPLSEFLRAGRPVIEALSDLLESAALAYVRRPERTGCLVLEAARGNTKNEGTMLARRVAQRRRGQLRKFVALSHPDRADIVTDYVSTVMSGLSASAREGMNKARLLAVAKAARTGLGELLQRGEDVM